MDQAASGGTAPRVPRFVPRSMWATIRSGWTVRRRLAWTLFSHPFPSQRRQRGTGLQMADGEERRQRLAWDRVQLLKASAVLLRVHASPSADSVLQLG